MQRFTVHLAGAPVHAWLVNLDEEGEPCAAWLDAAERARAARYRFADDYRRFIARRTWLRRLLGDLLGQPAHQLRFRRTAAGKPQLADRGCDLQFSLSSTGPLAFCAVTWRRAIGADIEKVQPGLPWRDIAAHTAPASELARLQRLPANERCRAFLRCWTLREALAKAQGDGLTPAVAGVELTPTVVPGTDHVIAYQGSRWVGRSFMPSASSFAALVVRS